MITQALTLAAIVCIAAVLYWVNRTYSDHYDNGGENLKK